MGHGMEGCRAVSEESEAWSTVWYGCGEAAKNSKSKVQHNIHSIAAIRTVSPRYSIAQCCCNTNSASEYRIA